MKIGTDIVQISRIEKSLQKHGERFKKKFLTDDEAARIQKTESIAGIWAAKEAVAKALGCGIGSDLAFHDITVVKDSRGAPRFQLSEEAQKKHRVLDSSLSISHDGGFAIAVVTITVQH